MNIMDVNRLDFVKEYDADDSQSINSEIFKGVKGCRATYGVQLYHKGLTNLDYSVVVNVTYTNLNSRAKAPTILVSSYTYNLDSYAELTASSSSSASLKETHGLSKHLDLLYIPGESSAVVMRNSTSNNDSTTSVRYVSTSPHKLRFREYVKFYFTLHSPTTIQANDCTVQLMLLRKNETIFTFAESQSNSLFK